LPPRSHHPKLNGERGQIAEGGAPDDEADRANSTAA
jgi:hypothetical protein